MIERLIERLIAKWTEKTSHPIRSYRSYRSIGSLPTQSRFVSAGLLILRLDHLSKRNLSSAVRPTSTSVARLLLGSV